MGRVSFEGGTPKVTDGESVKKLTGVAHAAVLTGALAHRDASPTQSRHGLCQKFPARMHYLQVEEPAEGRWPWENFYSRQAAAWTSSAGAGRGDPLVSSDTIALQRWLKAI